MVEALSLVCVLMTGIAVGLSTVALLCIFKLRKGISISVNVVQAAPLPTALSELAHSPGMDALQKTLDKTEEERRKSSQSLDDLLGQLNEIMTGGNANG